MIETYNQIAFNSAEGLLVTLCSRRHKDKLKYGETAAVLFDEQGVIQKEIPIPIANVDPISPTAPGLHLSTTGNQALVSRRPGEVVIANFMQGDQRHVSLRDVDCSPRAFRSPDELIACVKQLSPGESLPMKVLKHEYRWGEIS